MATHGNGRDVAGRPLATGARGVVLCGGRSSRMGSDKALVPLRGRELLAHAVAALSEVCERVELACGTVPRYAEQGLPLLLDREPDLGPLGGIETALLAGPADIVLVIACDMPGVGPRELRALVERVRSADLDVCVLRSERGVEPLCGAWRTTMSHPVASALARGSRRVVSAFDEPLAAGRAPRVGFLDVAAPECVRNLNTPADLARERGGAPHEGSRR